MKDYIILLRGINVGGKNKVSMQELKRCLEEMGFIDVKTYIASGNVILKSDKSPTELQTLIEEMLPKKFKLDSDLIKVLVLTPNELKNIVSKKPEGFGDSPNKFHSDVIFLMGLPVKVALSVFSPKEGVDNIWPGKSVIYSQRLSSQRTKSRLNKIVGTKAYKQMTIRNWNTVTKLLKI